jgi:hypothetical protein
VEASAASAASAAGAAAAVAAAVAAAAVAAAVAAAGAGKTVHPIFYFLIKTVALSTVAIAAVFFLPECF